MRIVNQANLPPETHAALERALPEFGTLMAFVAWGGKQQPPVFLGETVVLDEYTHEVLAAWRDGLFLAFACT